VESEGERLVRGIATSEIEVTVDDPKAYTRPSTVRRQQQIIADTEIIDEICLENETFMRRLRGTP